MPGLCVQGGDPTGTGGGGESIYVDAQPGKEGGQIGKGKGGGFRSEIHTRLKFNHRGILAMANDVAEGGKEAKESNRSQFFLTLDACEHLNGKHTIFGKVTGETIFNVLRMGEVGTDREDRPLTSVKLEAVEVLMNPFDDIVPRDRGGS